MSIFRHWSVLKSLLTATYRLFMIRTGQKVTSFIEIKMTLIAITLFSLLFIIILICFSLRHDSETSIFILPA